MCRKLGWIYMSVLVLGLTTCAAKGDIISALVAYYSLNGNAVDASANSHDGILIGNPRTVSGKFGEALEFSGAGDYVQVADYIPVSGAADRAVTAWIKTSSTGINGIVAWGVVQSQRKWVIRQQNEFLRLEIEGAAIRGRIRLADDQWHHIAVSFANDGTPELGDVEFYIDGALDSHQDSTSRIDTSSTGNLEIGRNLKNDGFFQGSIDEVKIYNRALTAEEILEDMLGPPRHTTATVPSPADEATDIPREVILSWTSLEFADKHDVYFGTDFDSINNATNLDPMGPDKVYRARQDAERYVVPETLDFGQTYYWRIDEVNAPPTSHVVFKGEIWSFTVEPYSYSIEDITSIASSNEKDRGPENTINGSGLNESGLLHVKNSEGTMWLSSISGPQPSWIEYRFDRIYKLHEMWVWNYNDFMEPVLGLGCKDVAIEYSVDGNDNTTLGTIHEFNQAPGTDGYAHNTIVDLGGLTAKYIRLKVNSNWGGILNQYGLSEVRFFYIPVLAREPNPADGATNVPIGTIDEPINTTLGFRAGREAARHEVCLSTDEQAVIDGIAPVTTVTETSYGPLPLDIGQTYYWRVDEVNEAETPTTWQGDIWNFATQENFVIDDFEDYNDYPPYEIFSTWDDGYNDPTNGSLIANPEPPFAETSIVHNGSQSMPYFYDNSVGYSEATVTLSSQRRDWTIRGIGSLSLWFRGYPASVGSFTEAPPGIYTMTASGSDIGGASDEFHYAYKEISGPGAIIAKVESIELTHNWARAGVMIRDTLEADSKHALMAVSANRGLAFDRRTTIGGITGRTEQAGITAPYWVKVERDIGSVVKASYSADGVEWTELSHEQITMDVPMYIGLALTARNTNEMCVAVFSNVQITGTVSGPWLNQDIGIVSNAPEPMYVALANSGGKRAVVYHDDPNATQIGTWTEWNIDLERFTDQGVNLTNVDRLSIGLGDKNNLQAGGSGLIYFDDIRLYPSAP